jgi:Tol biopolymer transport system component
MRRSTTDILRNSLGSSGNPREDERASSLSVGDRIGRFEIVGSLGAGGMGEVYRARDPELRREVAIKVLPAAFSRDAERRHRFEREARVAASLNHPNIIAVYDVGVHGEIAFIVTELLEGQTLRQRMSGNPLPPRTAVDYGIQIADGLAAGHERGIVHRDVKPDNLFVTKDERIKILDFGLARIIDPAGEDEATATITTDGVSPARVIGTAPYMSPEQARGLRTDDRSDIFSFGVVFHEMLAGVSPFARSTAALTIAAILHDDPAQLPSPVPPALDRVVRHCLEKNPQRRFQSVRDLAFDLRRIADEAWVLAAKRSWRASHLRLFALLIGLAIAAAAALGFLAGERLTRTAAFQQSHVARVHRLTDLSGIEEFPAISPDRRQVAFTASVAGGHRQIFVRLLAGGSPVQITNDALDHESPRWAPDTNSLVYFSAAAAGQTQGAVWTVPALGGSPRRVIDSVGAADVSRTGQLACFRLADGQIELVTMSLDGTGLQVLARSNAGYHLNPRWSPDGRWIAFQRGDGLRFDIFVIGSHGGEARKITDDRSIISGLTWLPDNSGVLYASSRGATVPYLPSLALWCAPINGAGPRQVTRADVWYEQPDVHSSGLLTAATMRMRFDLWEFPFGNAPADNVARAQRLTQQTGEVLTPTASPSGDEIAFLSDSGGHGNLWVMSTHTRQLRQITFENDPAVSVGIPVWSPDGRSIAFVSSKGHTGFDFGVWLVNPDGTNPRNLVKQGLGMAWSPDGRWVYYAESSAGALYKVPASGGVPVQVRTEPTRNVVGTDGATLYYIVERPLLDGRPELEIRAATPENGPSRALARVPASRVPSWQIVNPALSPNGEWLAMPLTDGFTTNIWVLSTRTGVWRAVTDFGNRATFIARHVSWSRDGGAILAAVGEGDADIVLLDGFVNPGK